MLQSDMMRPPLLKRNGSSALIPSDTMSASEIKYAWDLEIESHDLLYSPRDISRISMHRIGAVQAASMMEIGW